MIRFAQGNLLEAHVDALVNTVNEVGVMGKGIALMFRDAFPHNTVEYERAAKAGSIKIGTMFVTENPNFGEPRWIINFPTKKHWRQRSRLEWIHGGLRDLVRVIRTLGIESIAVPPLGCGNGGLDWSDVRTEIVSALEGVDGVDIVVYEPVAAYQGKPKEKGVEKLTPARALIAQLVRRYGAMGIDCTILEVHKLAWFLSRETALLGLKDPLRLRFGADKFGPYDDKLRHLMNALDGSYLHSAKRVADASPYDVVWFDEARRAELDKYLASPSMRPYAPVLERVADLIDGFESPFGMELLATVDWLLARQRVNAVVSDLRAGLRDWPAGRQSADRKVAIFDDRALSLALKRIVTRLGSSPVDPIFAVPSRG